MKQFMSGFDMVVGPVTQVLPFDVTKPYVTSINGIEQQTYVDWMRSCYYITMTLHPALSLPCGFASNGLPVGLQLVGRYRDDVQLLRMSAAVESTIDMNQFVPTLARR
jgi:amidase